MHPVVLAIHNILRWVVLILAVVALVGAYLGWFGKREKKRKALPSRWIDIIETATSNVRP